MNKALLALAGLALVAGCTPSVTVSNNVAAAEQTLTVAERVALLYTSLPRCPAAAVCSNQATVDRIKALDNQAYTAVMAARNNSALLSTAISAISAFSSATPVIPASIPVPVP